VTSFAPARPRRTDRAPARAPDRVDDVRARAVTALLTCVARHGLTKTTLDDVAREAGCARATLYRHFGDKRGLVQAALRTEADRLVATLLDASARATTLVDAATAVATTLTRERRDHAAFRFLLAHEPETVLPHLAFQGLDRLLGLAGPALAPAFAPYRSRPEAERLAEWVVRAVLDHAEPEPVLDLADPVVARRFVAAYLVPSAVPSAVPSIVSTARG
jgi:AcrR family transcriptional regulator